MICARCTVWRYVLAVSEAAIADGAAVPFTTLYDLSENLDGAWIRRELGVEFVTVDEEEILRQAARPGRRVGVVVTDPDSYRPLLSTAPPRSVVVLHLYDERYTPQCEEVANMPSVFSLYRPFSLERATNIAYIASVAAALADIRVGTTNVRQIGAALKSGRAIRSAVQRYNRAKNDGFYTVPIGYTAAFAEVYEARFGPIGRYTSLFDHALERDESASVERVLDVSFRGARGQFQRRTGVGLASQRPRSDCSTPIRSFSGDGNELDAATYLELMLRSRFVLCPPGFVTNESYRTYEALLCGALPVMLTTAVSQGTRPAADLHDVVTGVCWTVALRKMDRMAELSRRVAVARALRSTRASYREVAHSIRTALHGA